MLPITFAAARSQLCIFPSHTQLPMASNHSPCFYTNGQPLTIPDVPNDVPFKPSKSTVNPPAPPRCTSAHQAPLLPVILPTKPLSSDYTFKISMILPNARRLLGKISTLKRF